MEEPEKKRKIIGNQFIDSFEDIAKKYEDKNISLQLEENTKIEIIRSTGVQGLLNNQETKK